MADVKFKYGSQDKYENIEPDENTFYRIEDDDDTEVYLGDIPLSYIPVQKMPNEIFAENTPALIQAAENTPALIQAAVSQGIAADLWAIGDTIPITLNGDVSTYTFDNETYYAFIIGFDHNSELETNGKHSLTLQFGKTEDGIDIAFRDPNYDGDTSSSATGFRMNTSNTNVGGWESCWMRGTICPAFYDALPSAWQKVVSTITKYQDNTGSSSNTDAGIWDTNEQIFLLAEYEIFGSRSYANTYEQNYQQQYDYYAAGNSKIKYKHFSTGSACDWWSRSAYYNNSNAFCIVNPSGIASTYGAYYSIGLAPALAILG